jgi:hypothetical protein
MSSRPRHTKHSRICAIAAFAALAGAALPVMAEVHGVKEGGTVIPVGGGGRNAKIEVRNDTGRQVHDVTVHVFVDADNDGVPDPGATPPNISGIDITDDDKDAVDDDGGGTLGGDETDTTDGSPGRTGSSIVKGGYIDKDKEITVQVTFDGDTPEGTKVRVKFSERGKNGVHADLCAAFPLGPGELADALISGGQARAGILVTNVGPDPIGALELFGHSDRQPFDRLDVDGPFAAECVELSDAHALVALDPPLMPGETALLRLGVGGSDIDEATPLIVSLAAHPGRHDCPADFNGDGTIDTRDVLQFLNAWTAGCK